MSRNRLLRRIQHFPTRTHYNVRATAFAEAILDSQTFSEEDATKIVNRVRLAFTRLLEGTAEPDHFITLGCAVNVATIRAEAIDPALVKILQGAGSALMECERINDVHGRYGLTGPGRQRLAEGIDAYEAILRASSPKQMQLAETEVLRRLSAQRRPP